MAVVIPFGALRYDFSKAGAPEKVCCPPFDVVDDPSEWTGKSPHNAILLEGGERLGTKDPYGDAKKTLDGWMASGILCLDETPAFYTYEAAFTARDGSRRVLRGIAALLELTPFSEGVVLPHEFTLSGAKEDRSRLMSRTGCQFSAVYGLYDGEIPLPPARPLTPGFVQDGVTHSLGAITDPAACKAITDAFADKKIFIADGHHRYGTLLRLREETGRPRHAMVFLAGINDPGVDLWATHRVVRAVNRYGEDTLRGLLEKGYELSEGDTPEDGTFVWITGSGCFRLTPKQPWAARSSVAALHGGILEPLLGIDAENMAEGRNLIYTRDPSEAKALVREGEAQCAFLLPPPKMSEMRQTVLAGEKMPQKSTYFFPKVITGLFMRRF